VRLRVGGMTDTGSVPCRCIPSLQNWDQFWSTTGHPFSLYPLSNRTACLYTPNWTFAHVNISGFMVSSFWQNSDVSEIRATSNGALHMAHVDGVKCKKLLLFGNEPRFAGCPFRKLASTPTDLTQTTRKAAWGIKEHEKCLASRRKASNGVLTVSLYSEWLRAERSGIESRWGRDFPPVQTGHGAHTASCTKGTRTFPRVKSGRGVTLTPHPF